jgi:hypothetical protein
VHAENDAQCCGDDSFELLLTSEGDIRGFVAFGDVQELVQEIKSAPGGHEAWHKANSDARVAAAAAADAAASDNVNAAE